MIRSWLCLPVLVCHLNACTSWRVQTAAPQQVLADKRPAEILVTPTTNVLGITALVAASVGLLVYLIVLSDES